MTESFGDIGGALDETATELSETKLPWGWGLLYTQHSGEEEEEVHELEYGHGGRDAASSSAVEEGGGSDAEYEVDDEDEEEEALGSDRRGRAAHRGCPF